MAFSIDFLEQKNNLLIVLKNWGRYIGDGEGAANAISAPVLSVKEF